MIDHITLNVSDLARSRRFYEKALAPLGYSVAMKYPGGMGLRSGDQPDVWLARRDPTHTKMHVAFRTRNRKAVDDFHAGALAAGGRDNGPPGVRLDYGPNYYGAFALDPDENNIEAVCHAPAARPRPRKTAGRRAARPARKRRR